MPPPPQPPTQATPQPSAMGAMVQSMAPWELFIVGGAALLILFDLVFGIVLDRYYAGALEWLAAAVAVVAFVANRQRPGSVPMYRSVMLLAAAAVALIAGRDLIIEVIYIVRDLHNPDAMYLLGFITWAVAAAIIAWGGWVLWRSRTA
jgi:hypothetical protein